MPKVNPEWIEKIDYVPREERPEWNIVGLLGQVYVKVDSTVSVGDRIEGNYGIGTKTEDRFYSWKAMEIVTPYSDKLGYGIAICLIK
ncbi:peptidase G2 autoproteolytic cleavage domain-containing protein [Bacillus amyloliquefaciens]|uniref:peptidase G2 autoproteolytic cleavage domain-containing protein n=1 Tax=Bacillus amyloliquefaciens TaxID=1390 RepID=UPI0021AB0BDC|nr:peptidase G2 autoproteolytic cleavage domain-containing protein [Bacillus amyloliquefaciens]